MFVGLALRWRARGQDALAPVRRRNRYRITRFLFLESAGEGTCRGGLIATLLAVLSLIQFSGPSGAEHRVLPHEVVQSEKKADSRLVIEIPEMLQNWTGKCLEKERAGGADAPECWRKAAAAVDEYASGFDGPLVEEIHRIRSTWLQRARQLQSSRFSQIEKQPPVVEPASILPDDKGVEQSAATRPVQRKLRPEKTVRAAKVLAGQGASETVRSARQRKKLNATSKQPEKPPRLAKTRAVNVVPAVYVLPETRQKKLRHSKVDAHEGGMSETPSETMVELVALRKQLARLADRLECLSRKYAEGAN